MLRTPLVAALLSFGAATQAQNVTLHGIMDIGVEHLTNVNAQGNSLTRMPNLTGTVPSRIGVRGTEDLGGGWQALFNLESGIALKSGGLNNGGRMWGRAAHVGLAGPFGRLTLGRQVNMTILAVSSHVMGPALYSFASHDPYDQRQRCRLSRQLQRRDSRRDLQPRARHGVDRRPGRDELRW